MTVLTKALRRLDSSPKKESAAERAEVHQPLVLSSCTALPVWPTGHEQPNQSEQVAEQELLAEPEAALDVFSKRLLNPLIDYTPPVRGEIVLACDLLADSRSVEPLAAGLAAEGRRELSDDVAVVEVSLVQAPHDEVRPQFIEANEPGLYSAQLTLANKTSASRSLLVLIDRCQERFVRTVFVIDGRSPEAIALVTPRVDDAVLLANPDLTPEIELLRVENQLRAAAKRFRPRLLLAA